MIFCDGSLHERGCLGTGRVCQFHLLVNRACTLQTEIMHGMRGQYSRVPPMPSLWCSCELTQGGPLVSSLLGGLNGGTHCIMGKAYALYM
jgi:hypothetical protein